MSTVISVRISKKLKRELEELGIDYLISPEDIAGHEAVKLLEQPEATEIFDFSGGKLSVFLFKIEENAPVIGKTLQDIAMEKGALEFRAVAFHRGTDTFLPQADTVFEPGDLVYVITKRDAKEQLLKMAGKERVEINNIMIVGGGRVGKVIARRVEDDLNVKLIEYDYDRSMQLSDILDNTLIINGDARDITLLEDEGIDKVDAFIAVTDNSETNILTCLHAKKYGVKKTIALVENLDYIEISKNIGIDTVINKKLIVASHIIKHAMGDEVTSLKCLSGINSDIIELVAMEGSYITKKPLRELKMPAGVLIGGIIRGEESYIAVGDFKIEPGDNVVVFSMPGTKNKVEKMFHKGSLVF